MRVHQFVPSNGEIGLEGLLEGLSGADSLDVPFADIRIEFCDRLSQSLFAGSATNHHPEVLALAFWLRRSSLIKMRDDASKAMDSRTMWMPRGLSFHVAPGNVDTIFMYSWAISFLCGNSSLLRISRRRSDQVDLLCHALRQVLSDADMVRLANTLSVVTYDHDDAITQAISEASDVRVIWGGDFTVDAIRSLPARRTTKDLVFPDRHSIAVIHAGSYLSLGVEARDGVAKAFFNDSYWFGQMACSSPRSVIWIGEAEVAREAESDLFARLQSQVSRAGVSTELGAVMAKLGLAFELAMRPEPVAFTSASNHLTRLSFGESTKLEREHCGGGLFYNYRLDRLQDLSRWVGRKDQTLTHLGFSGAELRELVCLLRGRGVDRLVPIGRALDFHRIWDGYDLVHEMTRKVQVEEGNRQ